MMAKSNLYGRVTRHDIEHMAAIGMTVHQISSCLGLSRPQLAACLGSELDVLDALKRGRDKGMATFIRAVFQEAAVGNVLAQQYILEFLPAQGRA